jgi:hypothetical protein
MSEYDDFYYIKLDKSDYDWLLGRSTWMPMTEIFEKVRVCLLEVNKELAEYHKSIGSGFSEIRTMPDIRVEWRVLFSSDSARFSSDSGRRKQLISILIKLDLAMDLLSQLEAMKHG